MVGVFANVVEEALLIGVEWSFEFLRQQFGKSRNCVERRTQFVAHIGPEFAGRPRELSIIIKQKIYPKISLFGTSVGQSDRLEPNLALRQ